MTETIMSVTECLSLCAMTNSSKRFNINIIGLIIGKTVEQSRSNSSIQTAFQTLNSNIGNLLGICDLEKKMKLTIQDENTLDQIDFYYDCKDVILPEGILVGTLVEIKHLFLRNNPNSTPYLAEQSYNAKKGTKSTHISIIERWHKNDYHDINSLKIRLYASRAIDSKLQNFVTEFFCFLS